MTEEVCKWCGHEIDLAVCWCGTEEKDHNNYNDPHSFVPMGCTCDFVDAEDKKAEE